LNGSEANLIQSINKILPPTKEKEQLADILSWCLIVLNILGVILLISQGLDDFSEYAAFYCVRVALSVLMIIGAFRMKKRALLGWRLAFYPLLVSLVINIFVLNILGIIFHCFFVYSFIQVRELYS